MESSLEIATVKPNGGKVTMEVIENDEQKASETSPYVDSFFCLLFKSMALYEKSKKTACIQCSAPKFTCSNLLGEGCVTAVQIEGTQSQSGMIAPALLKYTFDPLPAHKETRPELTLVEINQEGNITMQTSEDMGPPPGFEGPPAFVTQTRRSPRLLQKHGGKYVSILQRAQHIKNSGSSEVPSLSIKKKATVRVQVQQTYLEDSNPLTTFQAEAVLARAGVEMEDALRANIKKMVMVLPGGAQEETMGA